jgi:hypothetical protein
MGVPCRSKDAKCGKIREGALMNIGLIRKKGKVFTDSSAAHRFPYEQENNHGRRTEDRAFVVKIKLIQA